MEQREIWDNIATEWDTFRKIPMDEAAEFIKNKKGLVLDLGCGSGRNFVKINGTIIGTDFSSSILNYAKKNTKNIGADIPLILSDATDLPFADGSFDSVLCSATLHCVKFNKHKQVLAEIKRVAKNGAAVFVSVWNKNQPRFDGQKKEAYIPWTAGGIAYQRYYYLYSMDELKAAMKKYFSNVTVFGSSEKAFGKYPKNIIAVCRVKK